MAENHKLGKGLTELFGGQNIDDLLDEIVEGEVGKEIPISEIRTNPYQPRKTFDEDSLKELSESIKTHGVFQPILVRKAINGYELVAGERRLRASKMAELSQIPAIIVDFDDNAMMEISLLENIQRENLSAIEEAEAYQQLQEKLGYKQENLAERVGKSRTYIANLLRLLKLPGEIQEMVRHGELSYGQARTILSLDDEDEQLALAEKAKNGNLSVRQLEEITSKKDHKKASSKPVVNDPFLESVRYRLQNNLGTAVSVDKKQIVIKYNTTDDLNRILEKLGMLENSLND